MDEQSKKQIFLQAAGCMENLVSSSGHLTSYSMDWGSFQVTGVTQLGKGLTEFTFAAMATAQGEFMSGPSEPEDWEPVVEEDVPAAESVAEDDAAIMEMEETAAVEAVPLAPSGEEWVPVSASIVLDASFRLALHPDGSARLEGYTCLPPAHWHPDFMGR